jgi:hypothetical protein
MSEEWRGARLTGGGPDFTEIDMVCPLGLDCCWLYTFEDEVTLGEVHEVLAQHMQAEHGE